MRLLALIPVAGLAIHLASPAACAAADRALLVGVDAYADEKLRLEMPSAINDVEAIKALLTSKLGFAAGDIKVLKDAEATKAAVLANVADWLGKGTKPGERAYFYYAGMGYFQKDTNGDETDGLDEALALFDSKVEGSGPKPEISGLLSDDEFSEALKVLEGRNVTVVIDSGHSGAVTRDAKSGGKIVVAARTPQIATATRSIVVEAAAAAQKAEEGGFVETTLASGSLSVWSAVAGSQVALVDAAGGKAHGVFTKLYVEALGEAKADKNGNGVISNAELLSYVSTGSAAYCRSHADRCEMGLTPKLDPAGAHAASALGKEKAAIAPDAPPAKLDIGQVTDFLAKGNVHGVVVELHPPSPVHVGTRDIRFRVTSPHEGYLILLDLSDDGKLVQLYPNQFSRKYETANTGRLLAGSPLSVPDDYYGLKFNATAPSSGYIVAIVTRDQVDFGKEVKTRSIEVIPRQEAVESFLPKLAAALGTPLHANDAAKNTEFASWSVATLRYEIVK
ncbi:MAG: DUF4384 domain-containing protein [Pseudomonadota bacterium]|nr:DUF4384 domain-containing protein [Pseudomonadota bacterium]